MKTSPRGRLLWALCLAALAAAACQKQAAERAGAKRAAPEPLVTEEVPPPVDVALTTEYDVQARSSEEIVGARLPAGFPADLPLCSSAVVNHGPAGAGRLFVTLSAPSAPATVGPRCDRQIEGGGWSRVGEDQFERRGRRITVTYRQGAPGTWIRIEYPDGG